MRDDATSAAEPGRCAARPVVVAMLSLVLVACGAGPGVSRTQSVPPASTAPPMGTAPITAAAPAPTTSADACAVGAQPAPPAVLTAAFATALAFAPDGRLFFAERAGTIRVWQGGAAHVFATVPTATTEQGGGYSERGLLGLAVSPTFVSDRLVYAFYSDRNRQTQHVIRWRDCAGLGQDGNVLVTLPAGADCCHKGGRIAFGGDGMLYVTLGEEHVASAAQDTADVRGKVLRYTPSGGIPADNPFGPTNPVYAFGLRNPFGIAVAANGQMAVSSNGPSGDAGSPSTGYDTIVLAVTRGAGYQWPLCFGYSHPLSSGAGCGGQGTPDWSSEASTVIPTGMTWVDASGPPAFAGHLLLCTYAAGMLVVTPGSPHATVRSGPSQCTLDVVQGPDHAVYYSDSRQIYRQT